MAQTLETRCEKKPLFCLKSSPKNLYFTKNSLYEKPLFSKETARGRGVRLFRFKFKVGIGSHEIKP